jgi:broad specificity phosphatase PhoE
MNDSNPTLLDYLRHGQPLGGNRFRGQGIDDPLSDKGWRQMRDTVAALGGWDRVISSPLQRCVAFSRWLAEQHALPLWIEPDLREVGFGTWEGKTRDQLQAGQEEEYLAFYRDPVTNRPPGAEPLDAFAARVVAVYQRLLRSHAGEHLLIVAHAGVIRATLGHVLQAAPINWYRTVVDNAAITRFSDDHQGQKLVAHNWRPTL